LVVASGIYDHKMSIVKGGPRLCLESMRAHGENRTITDLLEDVILHVHSDKVKVAAVLLNGYPLFILTRPLMDAYGITSVRLSQFLISGRLKSSLFLPQFASANNTLQLHAIGDGPLAPGDVVCDFKHWLLDIKPRKALVDNASAVGKGLRLCVPQLLDLPCGEPLYATAGETVVRIVVPVGAMKSIVCAMDLVGSGLERVARVVVRVNGLVRASLSHTTSAELAPSPFLKGSNPTWHIPFGFATPESNAVMDGGINLAFVDGLELDLHYPVGSEPLSTQVQAVFYQHTMWTQAPEDIVFIYGNVPSCLTKVPPPKTGMIWPAFFLNAMDLNQTTTSMLEFSKVAALRKDRNWSALTKHIDATPCLSRDPHTSRGTDSHIEGYWSESNGADRLPIPIPSSAIVDPAFLAKLEAMEGLTHRQGYLGPSMCRLCNRSVGCNEFTLRHDGQTWRWPEGLRHYYEVHQVQPSEAFASFICAEL
jgi:hypothetical protein